METTKEIININELPQTGQEIFEYFKAKIDSMDEKPLNVAISYFKYKQVKVANELFKKAGIDFEIIRLKKKKPTIDLSYVQII